MRSALGVGCWTLSSPLAKAFGVGPLLQFRGRYPSARARRLRGISALQKVADSWRILKALCSPRSNSFRRGIQHLRLSAAAAVPLRDAVCLSGMLREETWSFTSSAVRSHDIGMKNSKCHTIPQSTITPVQLELAPCGPRLVAEWQQRGPETLSGRAVRKLRLALAPPQSVITASAAG